MRNNQLDSLVTLEDTAVSLFGDYLFRQLLNITNDAEYFSKVDIFMNNNMRYKK